MFGNKLTAEDDANIEALKNLGSDEATEMYAKLRIAFDIIGSVSKDLAFATYRKRIRVERSPKCRLLAEKLNEGTMSIAMVMDEINAKRPG